MKNSTIVIWASIVMLLLGIIYFIGINRQNLLTNEEALKLGDTIYQKIYDLKVKYEVEDLFTEDGYNLILKNENIFYKNEVFKINLINKTNLIDYKISVTSVKENKITYNLTLKYKEDESDATYEEYINFSIIYSLGEWKIDHFEKL